MQPSTVLVLGAGYAGVLAAVRLARQTAPTVEVVLVNAVPTFRERVRDYEVAAGRNRPQRQISDILSGTRVRFIEARVESIDVDTQTVQTSTGPLRYDHAVWALGSATEPKVPGASEHARVLDGPGAAQFCAALDARPAARVAIVGGGTTGVEVATALAERENAPDVCIVTEDLLRDFAEKTQRVAGARLGALGVEIVNTRVLAVEPGRLLTTTAPLSADLILWAGGLTANSVAAQCGLPVDADNRLRVNATLACPQAPGLWAAGDAATVEDGAIPFGCKTAMPLGAHVADNIARVLAGESPTPFSFRDLGASIATGRRHGVMQMNRERPFVSAGRTGGLMKDLINHLTGNVVRWERFGIRYRWAKGAPSAPPVTECLASGAEPRPR